MVIYDKNGSVVLDVEVDDTSQRIRRIMGAEEVTLNYSLTEHVEIPLYSYIDYEGERYTLWRPENFTRHGMRNLEYTAVFGGWQELLKRYKYKNLSAIPYELKFVITARPAVLLQLLVDNMNLYDSGWQAGDCIDAPPKVFSISHEYCYDVLSRMADEWKTEWEIEGKTVHLRKVEKFRDTPLALSYGKGNGFIPGIARENRGDKAPVTILYVQGGSRNIDFSKYGSRTLLLPQSQELAYDGRLYTTDENGMYIIRSDRELTTHNEDSYDAGNVYPSRVGTVAEVIAADAGKHLYDFTDTSIPDGLDFEQYLIAGEAMTVIFQSGALAGREFEVKYTHDGRRFEIVPAEMDGYDLPNENLKPAAGDTYAVFHVSLPDAYVCNNATQEGASWDMFREAVRYFRDMEDEQFSVRGELDGIWAAQRWTEIGGQIVPGGHVSLSDTQFQAEPVRIRITGVTDYINRPHSPEIELSNAPVPGYIGTDLGRIDANEVVNELREKQLQLYTRRRFRDVEELAAWLGASLLNFEAGINPVTVHAMMQYLGDRNLQFIFVGDKTNPEEIEHSFIYDPQTKVFGTPAGIIRHQTIGIDTLAPAHDPSEYRYWDIAAYTSPPLDGAKALWLYTRVERNGTGGTFLLSETAYGFDSDPDYYYLLTGFLNSEFAGERSWTTLYGWSEWTPGMMRVNRIVSGDGDQYWDMLNKRFFLGGGNTYLSFNTDGDGQLKLKGTIVQSPSGDESVLGPYRGSYNSSSRYYEGDRVFYNGSTYRCIATPSGSGYAPTNTTCWALEARAGTNGINGTNGSNGNDGRIFSNRGDYDSSKTYTGNSKIAQVVRYDSTYFYSKNVNGSFSNKTPSTGSSYWAVYGASFESLATGLLFADKALIAGLWFDDNGIISDKVASDRTPIFMVSKTGQLIIQCTDGSTGVSIKDGEIYWQHFLGGKAMSIKMQQWYDTVNGNTVIMRSPRIDLGDLPTSPVFGSGTLYNDNGTVKIAT